MFCKAEKRKKKKRENNLEVLKLNIKLMRFQWRQDFHNVFLMCLEFSHPLHEVSKTLSYGCTMCPGFKKGVQLKTEALGHTIF